MKKTLILIMMIIISLLCGCSGKADDTAANTAPGYEAATAETKEPVGTAAPEEDADTAGTVNTPDTDTPEEGPEKTGAISLGADKNSTTLAERMTGKYTYRIEGTEGSDIDEYCTMHVISFCDNLYAYCTRSMADDDGAMDVYSFWICEFIPDDASVLTGTASDSAQLTVLRSSVMSNAGMYWDSGRLGTVTLSDEGLTFDGFSDDPFLVSDDGASRTFTKDDRAPSAFSHISDGAADADAPQGLWALEDGDAPLYIYFEGKNMYIYQKSPGSEVFFTAGKCDITGTDIKCTANTPSSGDMPLKYSGDLSVDGDTLSVSLSGDALPDKLSGRVSLKRIDNADVRIFTMDDVKFSPGSFGQFGNIAGVEHDMYDDGFYGVWAGSAKLESEAYDQAVDIHAMGYDSCVVYCPEWEDLTDESYYSVSAGQFDDEDKAQEVLSKLIGDGYADAYVKFSGKHRYTFVDYYNYGDTETAVYPDKVLIRDVSCALSRSWFSWFGDEEAEMFRTDLYIDEDTVFDETCDMQFFANHEEGDTPLEWYRRNFELMQSDPDTYMANGPALSGVFEVSVTGSHIDRFYGSYWWD